MTLTVFDPRAGQPVTITVPAYRPTPFRFKYPARARYHDIGSGHGTCRGAGAVQFKQQSGSAIAGGGQFCPPLPRASATHHHWCRIT